MDDIMARHCAANCSALSFRKQQLLDEKARLEMAPTRISEINQELALIDRDLRVNGWTPKVEDNAVPEPRRV